MRKLLFMMLIIVSDVTSWACTICKKQQPKILERITHGTGPDSNWDYVIVVVSVIIVVITFVFTIKYLCWPGEKQVNHVKHSILKPTEV